jgi:uncharacterized membrane protein
LSSRWLRGAIALVLALGLIPGLAASALAASPLTLTTQYPAVVVSPGSQVSFDLNVSTTTPARVDLALSGVPSSWTAALHGGGYEVSAAETNGTDPTTVRLDLSVPADATGTTHITVTATGLGRTVELPLDITVEQQASGDVTVTSDFPDLKGAANSSFTFNLTVHNTTAQDLTYTSTGQGPDGWTVDAKPTGSTQAVSGTVKAGSTAGISVTAQAPSNIAADTYPITVVTTAGDKQVTTDLKVEITGSYTIDLSTPDAVLTTQGNAGSATQQVFTITNTGTAPITNVKMTASPPTNWKVDFDQTSIDSIAPNDTVNVTATITPASDAIAGDYVLTFHVNADQASTSQDLRFTVQTSILGAIIGAGLIIIAIGGLWWVFQRYGRR